SHLKRQIHFLIQIYGISLPEWIIFCCAAVVLSLLAIKKLHIVRYHFRFPYRFTVLVFVGANLQSPLYTNQRSFSDILMAIFRLISPYHYLDEIRLIFVILSVTRYS